MIIQRWSIGWSELLHITYDEFQGIFLGYLDWKLWHMGLTCYLHHLILLVEEDNIFLTLWLFIYCHQWELIDTFGLKEIFQLFFCFGEMRKGSRYLLKCSFKQLLNSLSVFSSDFSYILKSLSHLIQYRFRFMVKYSYNIFTKNVEPN